ncbi:MAG: hypothetical protein K6V73_04340 [Firmicutes bacterium]|nr:hypothetical protein [Bacillota bacterium]
MPRLVDLPVRRLPPSGGRPGALLVGRRRMMVRRLLERWRESGEWWEGEGEREVERLLLADGAVVEISAAVDASGGVVLEGGWRLVARFD